MASQAPTTDISERGQAIYRKKIEPTLTADDKGRFVVIDVDSGDYEIADRDIDAALKLKERRKPGRFFGLRVGYNAAYRFGLRSMKHTSDVLQ